MIAGSGNIVHNLGKLRWDLLGKSEPAAPQAIQFDADFVSWLQSRDMESLSSWQSHPDAKYAAPTPEHLIPALIIAGAQDPEDELNLITRGNDGYSVTMTSFAFKPKAKNEDL
jgi:4,5-DOPA dioxygenase extradiol